MKQDFNCGLTVFILRLTLFFFFFLIPRWCGLESWICSGGGRGERFLLHSAVVTEKQHINFGSD